MADPKIDPTVNLALIVGLISGFVAMIRNAVLLRRDVDDNKSRLGQHEVEWGQYRAEHREQMAKLTVAVERLSQSQSDITTILTTIRAIDEFSDVLKDLRRDAPSTAQERERRGARDILGERHRED